MHTQRPDPLAAKKQQVREKQLPKRQHVTYQFQRRKCGKANCGTCNTGGLHGPYWYAYFRLHGKLVSRYIGKLKPEGAA